MRRTFQRPGSDRRAPFGARGPGGFAGLRRRRRRTRRQGRDLSLKRLGASGGRGFARGARRPRQKLETDMQRLRDERESLNRTLLEAADKLRTGEERAAEIEARLAEVVGKEETMTASLESRRAAIGRSADGPAAHGPPSAAGAAGAARRHSRSAAGVPDARRGVLPQYAQRSGKSFRTISPVLVASAPEREG